MRKVIGLLIILLTFVAVTDAQTHYVTKFLGIPVDGSKTAMIQKLKQKGFTYNSYEDYLTGEFNGRDVNIYIGTNNNKVWRIMLSDAVNSKEEDIKIRFNYLCRQFAENPRYCYPNMQDTDYTIPQEERISYEMTVNHKRYEAAYWQRSITDSAEIMKILEPEVKAMMEKDGVNTQEGLDSLSDEQKEEIFKREMTNVLFSMFERLSKKSVWFLIYKDDYEVFRPYRICVYYDNEYNHSNGEDL